MGRGLVPAPWTAISGAMESTSKVRTADKGTKLTVRVTGSRFGYTTVSRTSGARSAH